jgi:SAM-dependent methyltransferase
VASVTIPNSIQAGPRLLAALRQIYQREPAVPWRDGGNLPWDDPDFSRRMLAEHLDESHGAASRPHLERLAQLQKMWHWLDLSAGTRVLDVTCGPGLYAVELARRGCRVVGVDFGPAAIEHARRLCDGLPCDFVLGDVREMPLSGQVFDAAFYLYGQFAVLPTVESQAVLRRLKAALRPGGRLLLEVLDEEHFDKSDTNWWYTDEGGLWGDFPYLHLGERSWNEEMHASIERYHILNLASGEMKVYHLADQAYSVSAVTQMLQAAGFSNVTIYPAWDGLALSDASEWVVYVAEA